jgi:dihydroorotate dehydrogenase (fumarate)
MQHGLAYLERVRHDLGRWLGDNGWKSVLEIQGQLSRRAVADPAVYERVNYLQVVTSFKPDPPGTRGAR